MAVEAYKIIIFLNAYGIWLIKALLLFRHKFKDAYLNNNFDVHVRTINKTSIIASIHKFAQNAVGNNQSVFALEKRKHPLLLPLNFKHVTL